MEEKVINTDGMIELVDYIARNLVDSPEEVKVTRKDCEDGSVIIELTVAKDDMGKVIGKQGRIAKAIYCLRNLKSGVFLNKERNLVCRS